MAGMRLIFVFCIVQRIRHRDEAPACTKNGNQRVMLVVMGGMVEGRGLGHREGAGRGKFYRQDADISLNKMVPQIGISRILIEKRQEILALAQRRGARNIRIFGSVARNEAREDSDIDFLIDLDPDRSLLDVGGLAMDLSQLLDRPVDVVTEAGLRDRIRSRVLSEARAL